jgi:hypothetical protein
MANDAQPFEQIIQSLLDKAAYADALRGLVNNTGTGLISAVDSILLDESLCAEFNIEGYNDYDVKIKVLNKLQLLQHLLNKNLVSDSSTDYNVVALCIKFVNNGYSLTNKLTTTLNLIYKKYV